MHGIELNDTRDRHREVISDAVPKSHGHHEDKPAIVEGIMRVVTTAPLATALHRTGTAGTKDYRIAALDRNSPSIRSFWHDMPLTATSRGLFNFICEVPKYTAAKFQVSPEQIRRPETKAAARADPPRLQSHPALNPGLQVDTADPSNPIKQQCTRDGTPKKYPRSITFNHGAFPRTWTNPGEVYPGVGYGDNDMVDAVEVGMASVRYPERRHE